MSTTARNIADILELLEDHGVRVVGIDTDVDNADITDGYTEVDISVLVSIHEREVPE